MLKMSTTSSQNEKHTLYCENLYKGIEEKRSQFKSLDDNGKFMYMLSAGVDIVELVAKITYDSLQIM